jgi:phosphoribosylformylglycinamidine synthase II
MPVTAEKLNEIALSRKEYNSIVRKLGREPNELELGLFGALWSEHCGYKHSKPLLTLLPTSGVAVSVKAGEENAGVLDIGDELSLVFKVESHNHPSAVEPFQGAATGVGGIIRDIMAMGARPIALLNSLRFGPLNEPHNKFLFNGVIAGISTYGNCMGIPDVGGEIQFAPSYNHNPLVNAMCVGIMRKGSLIRAAATNPGSTLIIIGSSTGRDGIHGASGLASRTFEETREMRPTVQVGDPFMEKVLLEACLEVAQSGYLEAMQDLGAAGLTSAVMESVSKGGTGVEIDVALVPRRESGMTPYEVMLSESQERMLLVVKRGNEAEVAKILEKWDLEASPIGGVTGDGTAHIYDGTNLVGEVPISALVEAPQYRSRPKRPAYLDLVQNTPLPIEPDIQHAGIFLKRLLGSPNIASKKSVYQQYDHEVQTNTIIKPGQADAAVLRLRDSKKAIAISTDGNGRFTFLDPFIGGAMAVAEACRNVACTGATPMAITDCLNFGNPENPDVYFQLEQCIRGMASACVALDVPVISGNVSLYNETRGMPIYPTPVIGAVGLLNESASCITAGFKGSGDIVLLLGTSSVASDPHFLAGSEYLAYIHDIVAGQPLIDLEIEVKVQSTLLSMIGKGLIHSAHDCSDGGLLITLAESCILGNLGFKGTKNLTNQITKGRWDASLFGENTSRIVISVTPDALDSVIGEAIQRELPFMILGVAEGTHLVIPSLLNEPINGLEHAFEHGLTNSLA